MSGPYLESGSNPCVLCWDPALSGKAMCELAVMILNGEGDKIQTGLDLGIEGYNSVNVNGTDISGSAVLIIDKRIWQTTSSERSRGSDVCISFQG